MISNKATVEYYLLPSGENPVRKFIDTLEKPQKSKVFRVFSHFERYGLLTIIPHVKKLTNTPFWEIRIIGKDNIRIVYVSPLINTIFVLHGFIKKTQKTDVKEINIAYKRYQDWLKRKP